MTSMSGNTTAASLYGNQSMSGGEQMAYSNASVATQGLKGTNEKLTVLKDAKPVGKEDEEEEEKEKEEEGFPGVSSTRVRARLGSDQEDQEEHPLYCYTEACPESQTQPSDSQESQCKSRLWLQAGSVAMGALSFGAGLYNIVKFDELMTMEKNLDTKKDNLAADRAEFEAEKEEWTKSAGNSVASASEKRQ